MIRALVIAKDLSYPAGGPIYARRILHELSQASWQVTVWTNEPPQNGLTEDRSLSWEIHSAFFLHGQGLSQKLNRRRENRRLLRLIRQLRPDVCLILNDRPRTLYRHLKGAGRTLYFLHDISATCPQDQGLRILHQTQSICTCKAGMMSCLSLDKTEHCLGDRSKWRKLQRIARTRQELATLTNIDQVITNSSYVAALLRSNINGELNPQVLEPWTPSPAPLPASDRPGELRFELLFLGRLESYKGIFEAIEILAMLPDHYSLTIMGTGEHEPAARQLVQDRSLSNRVNFVGWLEGEDRDRYLQSAGLLLMPTLAAEAFGMAGPEALGAGVPVVAYNVGGIPMWCDGKAARCVPMADRDAAVKEILDMTTEEKTWRHLCQDARIHAASRFDEDSWRRRLFYLLTENHRS